MGLFSKIKSKAKATVNKVKASVTKNVAKLATAVQKKAPKASTAVKSTVSKLATVSKPKTTSSSSNSSKSSSSKSSSSKSSGTSSSLLQKSLSAIVPNVSADTGSGGGSWSNMAQQKAPTWNEVRKTGIGEGSWKNSDFVKALSSSKIPLFNQWGRVLSQERGITEGALDFLNKVPVVKGLVPDANYTSVQKATNSYNPVEITPEYEDAINKATIAASEEGVTLDEYLNKQYTALLSDNPTDGGNITGGGTPGTVLDQGTYSVTDAKTGEEVFGSLKEGASEEQVAQINALIAEYDRQQALNQNQLAYLGNQRQTALDTYGNQNKELMSQIATAKTNAERDVETGKQSLYETAQGTQRSNRNVLRALGILGSSAAGEMLTKPNTEAAKQVGNLQTQLVQRKKELDDLAIQKQNEYAVNVKELEDNYAKLVSDIQIDSRYNEDEKLAAIQNVNAAYSTRAAELDQAMLQWNQDIQTQAQQYALDIARMQAYQGITPDYTSLYNSKVSA